MECLREDIPSRYHKYIPRSYPSSNRQDASNCSNIATVNLPVPENNTRGPIRSQSGHQIEASSTAGLPSYRSRSNVQVSMFKTVSCNCSFSYSCYKTSSIPN